MFKKGRKTYSLEALKGKSSFDHSILPKCLSVSNLYDSLCHIQHPYSIACMFDISQQTITVTSPHIFQVERTSHT